MSAKTLKAIRQYMNRTRPEGDFEFVSRCLDGTRGELAKFGAEAAITGAVDMGYIDDDRRIADEIVAFVESEEASEPAAVTR